MPRQVEDISKNQQGMPGMSGQSKDANMDDYQIRYYKANLDDVGDVALLEKLETVGISSSKSIYILERNSFNYEGECFIVVCYMEKKGESLLRLNENTDATTDKEDQYQSYTLD